MKVTVSVSKIPKKVLSVAHVLVQRINHGLYFVEIDFYGRHRPEFCGHSEDEIMFAPAIRNDRTDKKQEDLIGEMILVKFHLPPGFTRNLISGNVAKRTWRGYIAKWSILAPAYEQNNKPAWSSFTNKPKRIK